MATAERVVIEGMFNIANKDGDDVPFILNRAQAELDNSITGRDIIPKARQLGMSTYILARYLVRCLSLRNRRAVVISHTAEATQKLLARVHYMLDHIRGPKAITKYANKNEITFPKTDSIFYIATAQSKDTGVGDTITDLHCSEVARWPAPDDLMAEVLQCVPTSGNVCIESTGKGVGNYYHRACMRAANNIGPYTLHFFSWLWDNTYRVPLTSVEKERFLNELDTSLGEPKLFEAGITLEQLMWRRQKLMGPDFDYNLDMFKEQYPLTLDECFRSRTHSYFNRLNYVPTSNWKVDPEDSRLYTLEGHPKDGVSYAMGCDASGGVGKDNSAIEVVEEETFEQVAEWASNAVEPDVFASHVRDIGKRYNTAHANVEKNNHGILTLASLMDVYPLEAISRNPKATKSQRVDSGRLADFGIVTTESSKAFMVGNLRHVLAEGAPFHSTLLKNELDTFHEQENGKLGAERRCLDDRVMALALCTHNTVYGGGANSEPVIMWV